MKLLNTPWLQMSWHRIALAYAEGYLGIINTPYLHTSLKATEYQLMPTTHHQHQVDKWDALIRQTFIV